MDRPCGGADQRQAVTHEVSVDVSGARGLFVTLRGMAGHPHRVRRVGDLLRQSQAKGDRLAQPGTRRVGLNTVIEKDGLHHAAPKTKK
jgi:hypothetical protein